MKPDREPVRLHDEVEALIQRQWTVPLALLLLLLWLGFCRVAVSHRFHMTSSKIFLTYVRGMCLEGPGMDEVP